MKRAFDIFLSLFLLVTFSWLFVLVGILVKVSSPGPMIYNSQRVGRDGVTFTMPKFRSMRVGTPEVETDLFTGSDNYITKFGSILRKSSLDELPQLFSVLKGDMSCVGPRPALCTQVYLTEQRSNLGILSVRPGITGWAQVNGRDNLKDETKIELDLYYIENWSLSLDLLILLKTLFKFLGDRNIKH